MKQDFDIVHGNPPSDAAFQALKAQAFAFASVAPRAADVLRAHLNPIAGSIMTAYCGNALAGYVALWPLHVRAAHTAQDLVLLGPLMVDPACQGAGLGAALMESVLEFADAQHLPPVLLVGDEAYYQRFRFQSGLASRWAMPGLAAPERILIRSAASLPLPLEGAVLPAFAPPSEKQAAA